MQQPTLRKVIWVKAARGNKGKTWFQKYVQSLLGRKRVIQLDLKNSIGNIMHILRKIPLLTFNTFMLMMHGLVRHHATMFWKISRMVVQLHPSTRVR